jgi:uncharacterized DUF497 family protein
VATSSAKNAGELKLRITYLQWDRKNIAHIAQHGVTPEEFNEVCQGNILFKKGRGEKIYLIYGQTENKRYLFLVVKALGQGKYRPITARNMTEKEKRIY